MEKKKGNEMETLGSFEGDIGILTQKCSIKWRRTREMKWKHCLWGSYGATQGFGVLGLGFKV